VKFTVKPAGNVPKEALDYFRRKKLAPDLELETVWGEEHNVAFTVAGVMARDILEGFRLAVDRALASGLTFEEFAKDENIERVMSSLGWWSVGEDGKKPPPPHRLRIVYDTNMRVARAAGQWERIQRTKTALPYLTYELGPSAKHREVHVTWEGTTLPADDPWWATHMTPNGYGCKCRVRQVSRTEAEDLGISERAPAGDPDPGWDHNPGAEPRG